MSPAPRQVRQKARETKTRHITVHLTDQEYDMIRAAAAKANLPMSIFLAKAALARVD